MSRHMGIWFASPVAAVLCGCATSAPPAPLPAPVAASSAPAVPATAKPKNAYGNYLRVVRNGQTLYCKKERDTGTRMVQETCLTEAQVVAQGENARKFMQDAQGIATTPVSGPNVR